MDQVLVAVIVIAASAWLVYGLVASLRRRLDGSACAACGCKSGCPAAKMLAGLPPSGSCDDDPTDSPSL